MRTFVCLSVLSLVLLGAPARAVDYAKVARAIGKEPAYRESPKYALLLFGKEATLRIWMVLDGRTLYLDRNGAGDLTGKDQRFARTEDCRDIEIADPDGKTRYLIRSVSTFKVKDGTREILMVDLDIKGLLSYQQYCSVELRGRAREARVAHFHGPLTMGPSTINWNPPPGLVLATGDQPTDLNGYVGTMNAEHGCWVVVRSHKGDKSAFPEGVFPVVDVEFPPKAQGGAPVRKRYVLDHFC
jgi:hypothetical protein